MLTLFYVALITCVIGSVFGLLALAGVALGFITWSDLE